MPVIADLTAEMSGRVFGPGTDEYDLGRTVFAGPGEPVVVVRPHDAADVARSVRFAAETGTPLSVRSGGHGGLIAAGSIVIDLSTIKQIEVVADDIVHIGAGATWGEVAAALSQHGLAVSSGDTRSVGVGGLTLGGGIGWLVRTDGLAIDLLREVEVVTADGEIRVVNSESDPELFWALRGGGGNFGVVTRFTFQAKRTGDLSGGTMSFDAADAERVIRIWRDVMRAAPDTANSTLFVFPPFSPEMPGGPQIGIAMRGSEAELRELVAPLLALDSLTAETLAPIAYADLLEDPPPGKPPFTFVGGNGFVPELTDDALAAIQRVLDEEIPTMLLLRALGGAFSRVAPDETAIAQRDSEAFLVLNRILMGEVDAAAIAAARVPIDAALEFTSGAYTNFTEVGTGGGPESFFPSETLSSLLQVKARVDPENLFAPAHALVQRDSTDTFVE